MDSQWITDHAPFYDVTHSTIFVLGGVFWGFFFYSPYRGGQRRDNVCVVEVRVGHETRVLTGLAWWW